MGHEHAQPLRVEEEKLAERGLRVAVVQQHPTLMEEADGLKSEGEREGGRKGGEEGGREGGEEGGREGGEEGGREGGEEGGRKGGEEGAREGGESDFC